MQLDALYHFLATYPQAVAPSLKGLRPQFQIHSFDTVASTNQTLWNMAEKGAGAGTVVLAQQQTAGRGQRGRRWVSDPGGIYVSLLLDLDWNSALAPLLTFASSWGIATLLQQWQVPIEIKWPNDLVVRAADDSEQLLKLGGILTEARTSGRRLSRAVVGVGLNYANINSPERGTQAKGADLQRSLAVDLQTLLKDCPVTESWSIELAIATVLMGIWQGVCWQQQVGTDRLMQSYEQCLAHVGQIINIDGKMAQIIGVTSTGHLKLSLLPVHSSPQANPGSQAGTPHPSPDRPSLKSINAAHRAHREDLSENILTLSAEQVSLSYNVAGLN